MFATELSVVKGVCRCFFVEALQVVAKLDIGVASDKCPGPLPYRICFCLVGEVGCETDVKVNTTRSLYRNRKHVYKYEFNLMYVRSEM